MAVMIAGFPTDGNASQKFDLKNCDIFLDIRRKTAIVYAFFFGFLFYLACILDNGLSKQDYRVKSIV